MISENSDIADALDREIETVWGVIAALQWILTEHGDEPYINGALHLATHWPQSGAICANATLMSGRQRMGVVISVLWLLAVPSYLIISSYGIANDYLKHCTDIANSTHSNSLQETDAARKLCLRESGGLVITPERMLKILLLEEGYFGGLIYWAVVLFPIALFWIVFGTVRWIARGFTGRKA